jgi:hypothetical protein
MRFLSSVCISLTLLGVLVGPSRAQNFDDLEKQTEKDKQRMAEIDKEVAELYSRAAKLMAERQQLRAAAESRPQRWPFHMEGTLHGVSISASALDLYLKTDEGGEPHKVGLLPKVTKITFSDQQPAKPTDLKAGVRISARWRGIEAAEIIIQKGCRQILDTKDADKIAKEVDFANEDLYFVPWVGKSLDREWFQVTTDKNGPVVTLTHKACQNDALQPAVLQFDIRRCSLYAIARNTRLVNGLPGTATKIANAEELAKQLRAWHELPPLPPLSR